MRKKLFKNYKSKKELRKEIDELKKDNARLLELSTKVTPAYEKLAEYTYKVESIQSGIAMDSVYPIPIEVTKQQCLQKLLAKLEPYVKWDLEDDRQGRRYLIGVVQLAIRR